MPTGKEIDESTSTWALGALALPPAKAGSLMPNLTAMEMIEHLRNSRRLDLEVQDDKVD